MSLSQLRHDLNMTGGMLSEKDKDAFEKFTQNPIAQEDAVEIFSVPMTCFIFEAVIRPIDKGLVIHLKNLAPALRNPKFFEYATIFIRDRIGKFGSLDVSFIGEVDSVNKLNSLDLMFTKYYPAQIGDMDFIKSHCAKIGKELDDFLVRELNEHVSRLRHQ